MPPRRKRCSTPGCTRVGKGDPPLCERCWQEELYEEEEEIEENGGEDLLSRILSHPSIQGLFNRGVDMVSGKFDQLSHKLDTYAAMYAASQTAKAQQSQPRTPEEDPRIVLGFKPDEPLTEEIVKKRQRELSKIFHSDRGGSDQTMARVNAAVDELLKKL